MFYSDDKALCNLVKKGKLHNQHLLLQSHSSPSQIHSMHSPYMNPSSTYCPLGSRCGISGFGQQCLPPRRRPSHALWHLFSAMRVLGPLNSCGWFWALFCVFCWTYKCSLEARAFDRAGRWWLGLQMALELEDPSGVSLRRFGRLMQL